MMSFISDEKIREEALWRMEKLKIHPIVIEEYKNGNLGVSDGDRVKKVPENIQKMIDEWEERFNNKVYHVIHGFLGWYEIYDCLSISPYEEDWDYEREIMDTNWVMAHGFNLTCPKYSESGSILVKSENGILKRIY